jgi:SAM domain (Sterile alpha motif)
LRGAPIDIVVWLRSLGLGKYEAAFRENEITEKVLNLTAEDLKELGISIVGHRRVEKVESLEAERENASPEVTVIDTDAGLLHLASIVKDC